jgi:hypothetical protein
MRRERRAKLTSSRFGSSRSSGCSGMRLTGTANHIAIRSRSASNHDSAARTVARKHIWADGFGSHWATQGGAQWQLWSRSTSTTQGENSAARLYPRSARSRNSFPFRPWTRPNDNPENWAIRRSNTSSRSPSTAPVTTRGPLVDKAQSPKSANCCGSGGRVSGMTISGSGTPPSSKILA